MSLNNRFFYRILLPPLSAMLIFFIAIYFFVLPRYRENLMDKKRETIQELTNTAWSIMQKKHSQVDGVFTPDSARAEAARLINDLRYGQEMKDYFWINDTTPIMVAHPYLPEMVGINLAGYRDKRGNNMFLDILAAVELSGEGFVEYYWQWKDDALTIAPKLSFVKLFEPWGWIVGTGIYIDDVNREIAQITRSILWISMAITLLIAGTLGYLARTNFLTEQQRRAVQEKLRESVERYKKLVEASTDGVMMVLNNEIVYCNPFLLKILKYQIIDFENQNPDLLSKLHALTQDFSGNVLISNFDTDTSTQTIEKSIPTSDGVSVDVIVSKSEFEREGKTGQIFGVKDVSRHKTMERELNNTLEKLQSIEGFFNLGVFRCTTGRRPQFLEINAKALSILGFGSWDDFKKVPIHELFLDAHEKREIFGAINEGNIVKDRCVKVKRADGSILSVLISLYPEFDSEGNLVMCSGVISEAYDTLGLLPAFQSRNENRIEVSAPLLLPLARFAMPLQICHYHLPVADAVDAIAATGADLLLVCDDQNEPLGTVTHKDLLIRAISRNLPLSEPVGRIMSSPVLMLMHYDLAFSAFNEMLKNKSQFLIVKNDGAHNYQFVSLSKLCEARKDQPDMVLQAIRDSRSTFEIKQNVAKLPMLLAPFVNFGGGVDICGKIISQFSDTITSLLIEQAIGELGPPPCRFAFLALGSEGRREQTLATDQDNAIVYHNPNPNEEFAAREYFLNLGSKVCNALSFSGFPLCKGGIMAKNEDWCKNFDEWQALVGSWLGNPNPQEILNICIFFDFRPVYGDFSLAEDLLTYCRNQLKQKSVFFYNMAAAATAVHLPNLDAIRSPDTFPIKQPGFALVNIIRLWALSLGITQRNTLERVEVLHQIGAITAASKEEIEQAVNNVSYLRIKNQIRQIQNNLPVNNELKVHDLSATSKYLLKKTCEVILELQQLVKAEYRIS